VEVLKAFGLGKRKKGKKRAIAAFLNAAIAFTYSCQQRSYGHTFQTQPKRRTYGHVLNVAIGPGLGPRLKRGPRPQP